MSQGPDVSAAIAGERAALDALWCAHRGWVAAVLLAHAPHRTDLDDLLQDVAVAFVRGIRGLKDGRALRPWLRTIAVNTARSAARTAALRRRGDRSHDQPITSAIDPDLGAAQRLEQREQMDALLARVAELPLDLREPLLLRAVQGLSQREVADVLGVPETTVETRLARARRALRAALSPSLSEIPMRRTP
jgi:RNA polymerase sigma-70 factor (ECF subfamily)